MRRYVQAAVAFCHHWGTPFSEIKDWGWPRRSECPLWSLHLSDRWLMSIFILLVFQTTEPLGNIKFIPCCPALGSNLLSLQRTISCLSFSHEPCPSHCKALGVKNNFKTRIVSLISWTCLLKCLIQGLNFFFSSRYFCTWHYKRGKRLDLCQGFKLQSDKSNFGKDMAIYIKMPLWKNYHVEIKAPVHKGICGRTFIAILLRMRGN